MKEIIVGTNILLQMAKQLKDRGEITIGQYACMLRRNKEIPEYKKTDIEIEVRR